MRLLETIVNPNLSIIGFLVEGKDKDFGGITSELTQRVLSLDELASIHFRNKQVAISEKGISLIGDFKISDLPMRCFNNGQMVPINNTMTLTRRILVNGELKGYTVERGDGVTGNYTTADVIRLAQRFKPMNFMLRTIANGKFVVAGKGCRLTDLPEVEIGNDTQTSKKARSKSEQVEKQQSETELDTSKSLLELFDVLKTLNGVIIHLPDEKYVATEAPKEKLSNDFIPLGIGEVASPYFDYGEKKLNANTTFKKPGTLSVQTPNGAMNIYTFAWSTKSLFVNGENHIKRFGVGVTEQGCQELISIFGSKLITQKITDKARTQPLSSILGRNDLVFFEVDTSKLSLMTPEAANSMLLSNASLAQKVKKLAKVKASTKIIKEYLKECESMVPNGSSRGRNICAQFVGYTPEILELLKEAGIDIYNGSYGKREAVPTSPGKASSSDTSKEKVDDTIQIEYDVVGSSLTGLSLEAVRAYIADNTAKRHKMMDNNIINIVTKLDGLASPLSKFDTALELKEQLDAMSRALKEELWKHKVACFILGSRRGIMVAKDQASKDAWVEKASRSKKAQVYECTEAGCEGLVMKLTNTQII